MHRWNSDSEGKFYDSKLLMNNSFRDCRNEYNGSPRNKQHSLKCTVNEVGTSDHNYSHPYPFHFFLRGVGTFLTSRFSSSLPKRLVFVLSSTYAKFLVWEVMATSSLLTWYGHLGTQPLICRRACLIGLWLRGVCSCGCRRITEAEWVNVDGVLN